MRKLSIRHWAAGLSFAVIAVFATSCSRDKKEAATTAKAFLQAYYVDLDFNKALQLSSEASQAAIREQADMTALNPYAKEESPDIVFGGVTINNPNTATCNYTCNRVKRNLPLRKLNEKWIIDLGGKSVETASSKGDFFELVSDNGNGFFSVASGEIKYRKRRQGNNKSH